MLGHNETTFLHFDATDGKQVAVWCRGEPADQDAVVVVANFSAWASDPAGPVVEYRIPNWPAAPAGRTWHEVTQDYDVPPTGQAGSR